MFRADERYGTYHQASRAGGSLYGRRPGAANTSSSNGGRFNYWPIVVPPPIQAYPRHAHPYAAGEGPAHTSAPNRHHGLNPDLVPVGPHSAGPGPAFVVAAEEQDPSEDTPKRCPAVMVACQRYRRNARLMTKLLDGQVVDVPRQDFEAVLSLRQKQRSELEEKLRATERETEALAELQRQKSQRWLDEDRAFMENLQKCRDKEFLLQVAKKMKGPSTRPTAPSNRTAFRLRYVP